MTRKTTNGYGHLRMSDSSIAKFIIHEDVGHRVRLVVITHTNFSVRCSRRGCPFRVNDISTVTEAEELARKHMEDSRVNSKNQR
jgi:hypothetical protein